MHSYTAYNSDTGEIVKAGICSNEGDLELNTPPGCDIIRNVFQPDKTKYKVDQGRIRRKTPDEITLPPPIERPKRIKILEDDWKGLLERVTQLESKINVENP